jgi:RTX calcium-binding nonapeptide repeat (4 copies)
MGVGDFRFQVLALLVVGFTGGFSLVVAEAQNLDPEELLGCNYDFQNGTNGDDILAGGRGTRDDMSGLDGDDELWGLGCGDWLNGNQHVDWVAGAHGNDDINLDHGHDSIPTEDLNARAHGAGKGGAGDDLMFGGQGTDTLVDHTESPDDTDRLFGEEGGDFITVQDGDFLDTGSGGADDFDICVADGRTEIGTGCETQRTLL